MPRTCAHMTAQKRPHIHPPRGIDVSAVYHILPRRCTGRPPDRGSSAPSFWRRPCPAARAGAAAAAASRWTRRQKASPRSTGMPFGLLEATPPASEPSLDNSSAREVSPAVLEAPSHHGQSFPRVLIQVIAAYCAIGGFASANGQMFVLIVSIPASSGGFGLGPATIGLLQNVAAVLGRVPGGLGFGARVGG
ncbi:unnamed protein product, partial [Prorocentrum cordatum]